MSENETKKRMNTLSFQDAEIESEVLKMVEESNGSLSKSKAISVLFRKLKEQAVLSEPESELQKRCETLQENVREQLVTISDYKGIIDGLETELEALKESLNTPSEKVLIHADDFDTPEALNYFRLVLTEVEALNLHASRGAFLLNMLRVMQVAHKGYIPATKEITQETWCK